MPDTAPVHAAAAQVVRLAPGDDVAYLLLDRRRLIHLDQWLGQCDGAQLPVWWFSGTSPKFRGFSPQSNGTMTAADQSRAVVIDVAAPIQMRAHF